jgi:hypothetical protein
VIEKSIWNYSGFQIWMLEVMDYWIWCIHGVIYKWIVMMGVIVKIICCMVDRGIRLRFMQWRNAMVVLVNGRSSLPVTCMESVVGIWTTIDEFRCAEESEMAAWQNGGRPLLEELSDKTVEHSSSANVVEILLGIRRQSLWQRWFLIDLNSPRHEIAFSKQLAHVEMMSWGRWRKW